MDSRSVFGFADCVAVCIATAATSQGSFRKSKLAMANTFGFFDGSDMRHADLLFRFPFAPTK